MPNEIAKIQTRIRQKERVFYGSIGTVRKDETTLLSNIQNTYSFDRYKELIKRAHKAVAKAGKSGAGCVVLVDEEIREA